jgi:hypothetical protein
MVITTFFALLVSVRSIRIIPRNYGPRPRGIGAQL